MSEASQQLADYLRQHLRLHSASNNSPIFLDDLSAQWQPLSAAQLLYQAERIGACLRAAGCHRGDTLLLFGELRPEAVAVIGAALLAGVRLAVLPHTSDLRELCHVMHATGARFVFATHETSAICLAWLNDRQRLAGSSSSSNPAQPLPTVLVCGDEFLGRHQLGSLNVFVRNSRVPDVPADGQLLPDGKAGGTSGVADALLVFSFDAIGRFRADSMSAGVLLKALQAVAGKACDLGPLRFSETGVVFTASVVELLVQQMVAATGVLSSKL